MLLWWQPARFSSTVGHALSLDFYLKKDVYELETFLKITKVGLFKNLLIVISSERILVHDLKSRSNKCYIPIQQGELAFFSHDYYSLKLAYITETHLITTKEFWLNKHHSVEGVAYSQASYSHNGTTMALALKNVLSIYSSNKLLRMYGFDSNVDQMVPVAQFYFVKL